jgi:hypothetical protein
MKTLIAGLAVLAGAALGFAPAAHATPLQPAAASSVFAHGRWGVGVGVGVRGGPRYVESSGYYRTEYRWVPVTQFVGYDAYGRPVYTTSYVQQAYTVWVPTTRYYAPRPSWGVGVGFGRTWH